MSGVFVDGASVLFQSTFQGTPGGTPVDLSLTPTNPTLHGESQIYTRRFWFGTTSTQASDELIGSGNNGAIELTGVVGTQLLSDWTVEGFFCVPPTNAGANDTVFAVGAAGVDRLFQVHYGGGGSLAFRYSNDGVNWSPNSTISNSGNGGRWKFITVQRYNGEVCAWFENLSNADGYTVGAPTVAPRSFSGLSTGALHPSVAPMILGAENTAGQDGNEGSFGSWRVSDSAVHPTCPATIPVPNCPYSLPSLSGATRRGADIHIA